MCRELSVDITSTSIEAQASAVSDLAENAGHSWQAPAMPTEGLTASLCLQQPSAEDSHPWNMHVVNNTNVKGVKAFGPSNEHLNLAHGSATPLCPSALMPSPNDAFAINSPTTHVMRGEHASIPFPPVPVDDDFDTPPCFANRVSDGKLDLVPPNRVVPSESLKTSDMRVSFSSFPMDGGARVDDRLNASGYPNVNHAGGAREFLRSMSLIIYLHLIRGSPTTLPYMQIWFMVHMLRHHFLHVDGPTIVIRIRAESMQLSRRP